MWRTCRKSNGLSPRISFKLNTGERKLEKKKARHLSSSATCVESLLECPPILWSPNSIDPLKLARDFALAALKRSPKKWTSDGSAPIYCRCRTLLLVVKHLPQYQSGVQKHLETILSQLERDPARFAVGEAWGKNPQNWYPANAFHTYWTLCLLSVFQKRFPDEFEGLCTALKQARYDIKKLHDEMLMWAHEAAGYQVALHTSESSTLDSDQLAWSLAIVITFGKDFQADLAQQDFISAALACLFQHQTDAGIWRRGAPLFHYRESGNAYCYIFETFAVLLRSALTNRKEAFFLRRALFPYVTKLLKLWRYAISTKIRLFEDKEIFGWSSGHRVNRKSAESWATASVYSFSQCLRRLIGIWAREEAAKQLKVVTSRESRKQALEDITLRGDTWASKGTTAATQLMIMFVNPFEMVDPTDELEPDSQPIRDDQARAAILFGPPGTSKTTLAKAIANAVGWDYVELHASHFVAEGLPNVQRTADAIFEKLKQLDRTVILFDEIDELVRAREHEIDGLGRAREQENDAFGRFLTTSMLPKLAELWKRQKVIYFVATNHIEFFDPAIIRAQRFDALIRVPSSFIQKKAESTYRSFNSLSESMVLDLNAGILTRQSRARRNCIKGRNSYLCQRSFLWRAFF